MDNVESYLILKYGSLYKAFHLWVNQTPWTENKMSTADANTINEFFGEVSLSERIEKYNVQPPQSYNG